MQLVLTPELMLEAYRQGLFPMAYHAGSPYIHWICPDMRGQLSITDLHISKKLKKSVQKNPFEVRINHAFEAVIEGCAQTAPNRPETWINAPIVKAFKKLHELGHAHSVECWDDQGQLAGGLYGLAIGSVFFGESMFSRQTDASKIALVHLAARLWHGGFDMLDTQFVNDHLKQFGVYEIPHKEYKARLKECVKKPADFLLKDMRETEIVDSYFSMRSSSRVNH
jgi:leucyl/phenylalanyl-tRNA--protein transferase